MVWLESRYSQFSKLFQIENRLNIKKVMGRNVWMCFVLTASTYISWNALEILMPYVNTVDICLTSVMRAKLKEKMEFPA